MILLPQECVKYTARNLQYRHKAHSVCMDDRVYWRTSVTMQTECFLSCHIPPAHIIRKSRRSGHIVHINVIQNMDKILCDES